MTSIDSENLHEIQFAWICIHYQAPFDLTTQLITIGNYEGAQANQDPKAAGGFNIVLLVLGITVGVIVLGYLYYQRQKENERNEANRPAPASQAYVRINN